LQKKQYVGVPSPNPLIVGKTNSRAITYYSYENEKYSKEKKRKCRVKRKGIFTLPESCQREVCTSRIVLIKGISCPVLTPHPNHLRRT
jgi:hypothetical protein